ncbi:hypothetical protein [Amycolatopsis sp. PS_44_ISF1]|uniref:hypothetical protein n=1 Tax=Amycolatopsis sp. PS_44_ISF1 TaxID=2974917 RepID=UPI0028DDF052|nr:hypothetical protein [Amycolatopsis sp. PS_44_ISF1]MDT8914665.1 hypothetical protein [Amycolatopsis sp. PS_44_ISF1]
MSDCADTRVGSFDGKIASLEKYGAKWGYIFLKVKQVKKESPWIEMEFFRGSLDDELPWRYSDRIDPDDYDTLAELDGGVIDWWGVDFTIRWLQGDDKKKFEMQSVIHRHPIIRKCQMAEKV